MTIEIETPEIVAVEFISSDGLAFTLSFTRAEYDAIEDTAARRGLTPEQWILERSLAIAKDPPVGAVWWNN